MSEDDLFAVARRMIEYADESGASERKQKDMRIAAEVLMHVNTMLAAERLTSPHSSR